MSYQALLFCPDEKTARVVSQVLSELEFAVEPCHEPFAAVKKLMVQHFDAHRGGLRQRAERGSAVQERAQLRFEPGFTGGRRSGRADRRGQGVSPRRQSGSDQTHSCGAVQGHAAGCARPAAQGTSRQAGRSRPGAAEPPTMFAQPSVPAPFPPPQSIAPPQSVSASAFELDAEPAPQPDLWTPLCSSTCRTPRFRAPRIRRDRERSPIRPSNIPGNRASLWLSRWLRPCAGPRKPRENPSLTPPLRVPQLLRRRSAQRSQTSIRIGQRMPAAARAAPARAREIPCCRC